MLNGRKKGWKGLDRDLVAKQGRRMESDHPFVHQLNPLSTYDVPDNWLTSCSKANTTC